MKLILATKLLASAGILIGGATTSTYFGTKTTVEQHLNHRGKKNTTEDQWKKVVVDRSKEPKSDEFKFKKQSTTSDDAKWRDLQKICEDNLNLTYKVFWKQQKEINENLRNDLINFCFSSQS